MIYSVNLLKVKDIFFNKYKKCFWTTTLFQYIYNAHIFLFV